MLDKIQNLLLWTFIATFIISGIVRFANRKKIDSVFKLSRAESIVVFLWTGFFMANAGSESDGVRYVVFISASAVPFVMAIVEIIRVIRGPRGVKPAAQLDEHKPQVDNITLMAWLVFFGCPSLYIGKFICSWLRSPAIGLPISDDIEFVISSLFMAAGASLGAMIAVRRAKKREQAVKGAEKDSDDSPDLD